jgi:hypothetical protein
LCSTIPKGSTKRVARMPIGRGQLT